MTQYLLDTNICIYYLKGLYQLNEKIKSVGIENCFISEITLAELKYGVEKSQHIEKNRKKINEFSQIFDVVPIFSALDFFAKEKARLKKIGRIIEDFDLLIGATAVENELVLVTRNVSDFERITNIKIEDWTKE